jgi:arsenite methyltransferase
MPEVLELRSRRSEHPEAAPETLHRSALADASSIVSSTVFDRCWRQYALCREHLFTDHTPQIATALQPLLNGPNPSFLVEAGCGPGFYSRRLAARFPQLQITGIDLSEPLLYRARDQARRAGLSNCRFLKADALSLADFPNQIDAVIASRLFLILAKPAQALDAIFTALRPGGLCFIAEPTSLLSASIPLFLMRFTERLGRCPTPIVPLPQSRVLSDADFEGLIESQPWRSIRLWKDRQYQCAVCKKAA